MNDEFTEELTGIQKEWAAKIEAAGVPTEAEMRAAVVPTFDNEQEILAYIKTLTDRPHDYGTCVYAMSMAATAAFNFVAHRLGVSGFQASCADMDILRRTRDWEWGKILNYQDLLYPQYLNEDRFPTWQYLLEDNRGELAKRAAVLLENSGDTAHPDVRAHWQMLVDKGGDT